MQLDVDYDVEVDALVLVVLVLGGGTLKNVGGPLYVCEHCMSVRAYVCVKYLHFSGGGEVFGFVGRALEDFSGGPSHSAEIPRLKKKCSLVIQMSFLFLKGQLKTNLSNPKTKT